jgi:sialic acid synthase SpsE
MSAFKMASGELTNLPFQAHVARKGKPMIVSTGMSNLPEVTAAVGAVRSNGNPPLILLHCTSNYPAAAQDVNLRAMLTLSASFHVPVGYSDHTEGIEIPGAAAAMGACMLEKHFTLDRQMPGPDHRASLEPVELAALVQSVRRIEAALGTGEKKPASSEESTAMVARKSLHLRAGLPAGHALMAGDLIALRPGTGISPSAIDQVVGRLLKKGMRAGSMLREFDLV